MVIKKTRFIIFIIILVFLLIISQSLVLGAVITGTVYDLSLQPIKGAVIKINTTPEQTILTRTGNYSIVISEGTYNIIIGRTTGEGITEEENTTIVINDDKTYNLDFVLMPLIEEIEEPEINELMGEKGSSENNWLRTSLMIVIILFLMFFIIVMIINFKNKRKAIIKESFSENDELEEKIMSIIKKERIITQKELRKQFPESESKISLVLSGLESEGRIKKIKRGRSNIIKYLK